MTDAKAAKPNIFGRIARYFKDLRSETKKVVWPTRKQVINNTIIVIATILIIGSLIWVLDVILQYIVNLVLAKA